MQFAAKPRLRVRRVERPLAREPIVINSSSSSSDDSSPRDTNDGASGDSNGTQPLPLNSNVRIDRGSFHAESCVPETEFTADTSTTSTSACTSHPSSGVLVPGTPLESVPRPHTRRISKHRALLDLLREDLADANACADRLRVRIRVHEFDGQISAANLRAVQEESEKSKSQAAKAEVISNLLGFVLIVVLVVIAAYVCWVADLNGAEMEYVRRLRREMLIEDEWRW